MRYCTGSHEGEQSVVVECTRDELLAYCPCDPDKDYTGLYYLYLPSCYWDGKNKNKKAMLGWDYAGDSNYKLHSRWWHIDPDQVRGLIMSISERDVISALSQFVIVGTVHMFDGTKRYKVGNSKIARCILKIFSLEKKIKTDGKYLTWNK
jgi:hypothetical protein